MVQGARGVHIHWPIFNRPGGAKLGEGHHGRAKPSEAYRVPPQAGHRSLNADVFVGQDTRCRSTSHHA